MLKLFAGPALIRAGGAIAQVLMTLAITHECGVTQAGIVFFGYSLVLILSTLARAGSELSALRAISHAYERDRRGVRAGPAAGGGDDRGALRTGANGRLLLVGGLSTIFAAVTVATAPWLADWSVGHDATASLRWAGLAIPAFAFLGLLSEFLKGTQRPSVGLFVQNLGTPCLVLVAIVVCEANEAAAATGIVCGAAWVTAVCGFACWYRIAGGCTPRGFLQARSEIWMLLRDARTLLVVAAAPVVMQWAGAIVLGFLTSPSQVAGYSVAARLAIAVSVVHSAASSVVAPQMAVAHGKGDVTGLHQVAMRTGILISAITWPVLIVLAVAAPTALGIFGATYSAFDTPLRILLVGQTVASLIGHSGMVLVMAGRYSEARLNSLVTASLLVIMTIALVPSLGANGAAISTSTTYVLGHLMALSLVRSRLGFWPIPTSRAEICGALASHPKTPIVRSKNGSE